MKKCLFCKKQIRDAWYVYHMEKIICMCCALDIKESWSKRAEEMLQFYDKVEGVSK